MGTKHQNLALACSSLLNCVLSPAYLLLLQCNAFRFLPLDVMASESVPAAIKFTSIALKINRLLC